MCEKFEAKVNILGPDADEEKEVKILNRVISWSSNGILYEADQRHADIIIQMLGLSPESKSLSTPGDNVILMDTEVPLSSSDATKFRAITARADYLA